MVEKRRNFLPKEAEIVWGDSGENATSLTTFPWRRFQLAFANGTRRDCLSFFRAFGPSTGPNSRRLAGMFCSDRSLNFEAAWIQALFDGIGVKK